MVIAIPLLVALVGLVVYLASGNPRAQEIGRLMFAVGLAVGLLRWGGGAVSLLH
jgi:hypothetical protein